MQRNFYSDSLPGVRPVIEGMDSRGGCLNLANEIPNSAIDKIMNGTPRVPPRGKTGITGLNRRAKAANPAIHGYFLTLNARMITAVAPAQTIKLSCNWKVDAAFHNSRVDNNAASDSHVNTLIYI
jgi:hypothetical protein